MSDEKCGEEPLETLSEADTRAHIERAAKIEELLRQGYSTVEVLQMIERGDASDDAVPGYRSGPPLPDKEPVENFELQLRAKHRQWLEGKARLMGVSIERVIEKMIAECFASDPDRKAALLPDGPTGVGVTVRRGDLPKFARGE